MMLSLKKKEGFVQSCPTSSKQKAIRHRNQCSSILKCVRKSSRVPCGGIDMSGEHGHAIHSRRVIGGQSL